MTTVAFIGLGIMGAPMARHLLDLLDAGFDVVGFNRSPGAVDALVEAGGSGADSIAQAVAEADVVATMVPDSPDVEAVLTDDGVFAPDLGITSDAKAFLTLAAEVARERAASGTGLPDRSEWVEQCRERKRTMLRRTHFENTPIKPQRVYEEMIRAFGRDTRYVSTIGLSQIAGAQFLHVYAPRHWINCGQAGPLGWAVPAATSPWGCRSTPSPSSRS